jgi:hypothetical protein
MGSFTSRRTGRQVCDRSVQTLSATVDEASPDRSADQEGAQKGAPRRMVMNRGALGTTPV